MNKQNLEKLWYGKIEYEPTAEDVKRLIYHYENLKGDTDLLIQACCLQRVSVIQGFREVCERLMNLNAQLKKMQEGEW